jgi:hypothetical protein
MASTFAICSHPPARRKVLPATDLGRKSIDFPKNF